MKKTRKILSLLLAMILLVSVANINARAANGVQGKINEILKTFPSGSYFTANGKACSHSTNTTCNNCKLTQVLKSRGIAFDESKYLDGWTCYAFASYCFGYIFGCNFMPPNTTGITSSGRVSNDAGFYNAFKYAKTGDFVYCWKPGDEDVDHYAIFVNCDSNGVTLLHNNIGGSSTSVGKIAYGYVTYKNLREGYGYNRIDFYRANNYDKINATADTQAPTISNVKITNITSAGYTVTCTVKDNVGVTRVAFPTWTHGSGQDDLLWKDGTISGSTATFTVKVSEHKNESGMYATHIYAYDAAGNSSTYAVDIDVTGTHTHSYTSTITRNPTCKTDGIRTYRCSCGASYTENIGKHAATHEGGTETRNARAATCKDTGYTGDTYCKGCGVCLGYGTSTAKNYNNHTGGTTIKNTVASTCTAEGYTGDTYCKGCDTKLSSGKAIAKIPHAYEEIARIYPDCIKTGLITYACYCGASYDEVIPANGHTETDWIIHKAATCTAAGTKYKECTVCEELLDIEIIPVEPHDYDIVVTEETCTTDGYSTYTCPDCGDVYVGDKVPAAGHTESEWIIDLEATCTEKGSKHIECTVCGETLKTESIAKTPHDYNYVVTDATCETDGYTTVTCPDCGDTYITDEVPAFGHNDENKDTLCDACGLQLTCEHCGRPVHEGQTNEHLCIIIMTIKLLINFLNMVTK